MTTYGPDHIVACPNCEARTRHRTMTSGNTFGARVWTDGKLDAPMCDLPPVVVKCHQCDKCYWLEKAEIVATVEWGDLQAQRAFPPYSLCLQEPSEEEYYSALHEGLAVDSQQEQTLRILAWWSRNDAFRKSSQSIAGHRATASGPCRQNLEVYCPT